jgi:hypothetical protein
MERFEFQLGLTNMVVVNAEGQGGGIAVNVRNCMGNHIDMDVKDEDAFVGRFTSIYGTEIRVET